MVNFRKEKLIVDMAVGETAWVVDWAFLVSPTRTYIRGDYTIRKDKGGTSTIEIQRTVDGVFVLHNPTIHFKESSEATIDHAITYWKALPVEN